MKNAGSRTFPRSAPSQLKGEIGSNAVAARVMESLGWVFRRTHNEVDFGIDGHFDVVENDGSITGRQFAVQIKSGSSYFEHKNPRGWTFHGDMKYLNYYYNYPTTVLILLVDLSSKQIYWVNFDKSKVVLANNSWSILVPRENTLEANKKSDLLGLLPQIRDITPELQEFWAANKVVREGGLIVCSFSLSQVSTGEFSYFSSFLDKLLQSKESSKLFKSRIEMVFDGYNLDPREVYEIPECTRFLCSLLEANPETIFFLSKSHNLALLRVLPLFFSLQRRATDMEDGDGKLWFEVDPERFSEFLHVMHVGLTRMADFLSFTKKKRIALFRETIDALNLHQSLKVILLKNLASALQKEIS